MVYLAQHKALLYPLLLTFGGIVLAGPVSSVLPAIVNNQGGSLLQLGCWGGLRSLGALAGAIYAGTRAEGDPRAPTPSGRPVRPGCGPVCCTAAQPGGRDRAGRLSFLAFSQVVWNTSRVSALAEPAYQARLQSVTSMAFTLGTPLAAIWGGAAVDRFGLPALLAGAGILVLLSLIVLLGRIEDEDSTHRIGIDRMKLTLIGGGGVRSPLFVSTAAALVSPPRAARVVPVRHRRPQAGAVRRPVPGARPVRRRPVHHDHHHRRQEALSGVAHAVTAIRVGFEQGRALDERIALRHGVLGQETTGPGGFAMALRSIPAILGYAELLQQLSPGAGCSTSPTRPGLVTQALREAGYRAHGRHLRRRQRRPEQPGPVGGRAGEPPPRRGLWAEPPVLVPARLAGRRGPAAPCSGG